MTNQLHDGPLRRIAENATLAQQEFNRAFVLMQYFGYLRRNPNDAPDTDYQGYNFWLNKLSAFNGDFVKADMVRRLFLQPNTGGGLASERDLAELMWVPSWRSVSPA